MISIYYPRSGAGTESDVSGLVADLAGKNPVFSTKNAVFVAPTGDDNTAAREKIELPAATLARAIALANDGDVIWWQGGSYTPVGVTTISKQVTIVAEGVVLNAVSGSDYKKIAITADNVTIRGLQGNGAYISGSNPDAGFIEVGGANCKLVDCYLHDHAGYLIRPLTGCSNLKVLRSRIANGWDGIRTTNYSASATTTGMQFLGNTFENNRNDGFAHYRDGWTGSGPAIFGTLVAHNTFRNNTKTGFEAYNGKMDSLVVAHNYIANSQYGISIAPCSNTLVANNVIKCGSYCGIEFADTGLNTTTGNTASGNIIDCQNEAGTYTGATGYAISSQSNNHTANLLIEGGQVFNTGNGSGGGTGGAIGISNHDNVTVRGVNVYGGSTVISVLYSNNIVVENVRAENTTGGAGDCYFIWTAANPSTTLTGFFYKYNTFNRTAVTQGYPVFQFYPTSGTPATFNDVRLVGNTVRGQTQTAGGSSFVHAGVNTVNFTQYEDNHPVATTVGGGQFGFAGSKRIYSLTVTNTLNAPGGLDVGSGTAPSAGGINALTDIAIAGKLQAVAGSVTPVGFGSAGAIVSATASTTGVIFFGTSGTKWIQFDGSNYVFATHPLKGDIDAGASLGSASRRWQSVFLSAGVQWGNPVDLAAMRNAAGVMEVNNGTAGTFRDVKLRRLYGVQTAAGTVTGTYSLDVTLGRSWTLTTTASTNLTITPTAAGVADQVVTLIITSDATGGDVVTFASPFKANGTMTLTASKAHTIQFISDGTNLYELFRTVGL